MFIGATGTVEIAKGLHEGRKELKEWRGKEEESEKSLIMIEIRPLGLLAERPVSVVCRKTILIVRGQRK